MILTSTRQSIRFVPAWLEHLPSPPVYLLRPGTVMERAQLEAELAGEYRAGRVFDFEVAQAFQEGVRAIVTDGELAARLIGLVQAELGGEPAKGEDREILCSAKEVIREHYSEYRNILAQAERRVEMMPLLAFRRFCVGWENVSADFKTGFDKLIPNEVLEQLDSLQMRAAGAAAYGLLYAGGQEKNSDAPSKSDDPPKNSPSGAPSGKVGKSRARNGRKIPA